MSKQFLFLVAMIFSIGCNSFGMCKSQKKTPNPYEDLTLEKIIALVQQLKKEEEGSSDRDNLVFKLKQINAPLSLNGEKSDKVFPRGGVNRNGAYLNKKDLALKEKGVKGKTVLDGFYCQDSLSLPKRHIEHKKDESKDAAGGKRLGGQKRSEKIVEIKKMLTQKKEKLKKEENYLDCALRMFPGDLSLINEHESQVTKAKDELERVKKELDEAESLNVLDNYRVKKVKSESLKDEVKRIMIEKTVEQILDKNLKKQIKSSLEARFMNMRLDDMEEAEEEEPGNSIEDLVSELIKDANTSIEIGVISDLRIARVWISNQLVPKIKNILCEGSSDCSQYLNEEDFWCDKSSDDFDDFQEDEED